MKLKFFIILVCAIVFLHAQKAQNVIVVYPQNMAFISRYVSPEWISDKHLRIKDVSEDIFPETINLYLNNQIVPVLEKTFYPEILDLTSMWKSLEGQTIEIRRPETTIRGKLVFYNDYMMGIRTTEGMQIIQPNKEDVIQLPPSTKLTKYSAYFDIVLKQKIKSKKNLRIEYLSGGLNWSAKYNLYYDEEKKTGTLDGWATIVNNTKITYRNAELILFAGDIQSQPHQDYFKAKTMMKSVAAMGVVPSEPVQASEFYMYRLPRLYSVPANSRKQISLIKEDGIPLQKKFIYYAQTGNENVQFHLIWSKKDREKKSILPAGQVYVYLNKKNQKILMSINSIPDVPSGKKMELTVGNAFDLKGKLIEVKAKKISRTSDELTYKIKLSNHKKKETVTVHARFSLPGGRETTIVSSSHPYKFIDKNQIEFTVRVPAKKTIDIDFTIRREW